MILDELIEQISSRLKIDPKTARTCVNKTMALIKKHAGSDVFNKISGAVPGAAAAADAEPKTAAAGAAKGGGMLGQLAGMASSALGGKAGGGLELASVLTAAGIDADKLKPFITTLVEYLKGKMGEDEFNQLLSKFPMLKSMMRSA